MIIITIYLLLIDNYKGELDKIFKKNDLEVIKESFPNKLMLLKKKLEKLGEKVMAVNEKLQNYKHLDKKTDELFKSEIDHHKISVDDSVTDYNI